MIIARPLHADEPDLLPGHQALPLLFVEPNGTDLIIIPAPIGGWTHDELEAVDLPSHEVWNAYLGTVWIGSSEI